MSFSLDMRPSSIIRDVRHLINDVRVPYRDSDEELLGYVNDGLREAVVVRPELFSTIALHVCTPASVEQRLSFGDAAALLEVISDEAGNNLTPFDQMAMNAFNPTWRTAAPGTSREWARFENDPLAFYVSPPAPENYALRVRYIRTPAQYGLSDIITDLPQVYRPALVFYVVHRAESKDDEHVLSARAAGGYQRFVSLIKG
jgi:hypothetical protein